MKKTFFILVILSAFAQISFAQSKGGSVSGKIADTTGKQHDLSQASVSVTPVNNPKGAQFVVTNKQGTFLIRNLKPGAYALILSFEGYQAIYKNFTIVDSAAINLGTMNLQKKSDEMATVIVEAPPMKVKGDTVEYNASMYATKPNAVAEDLLKKFPGIQVDASGNITAQGETVTRVLVNGKRFFSDDPKLATRNLPPDIIDKIQVFDDLDDQSKFSGFDDGNRVKTINITTKKDKRQGYFGRTVAGAGTNGDYDESVNMHRFDNDQQISLLAQANDINKQNFTIQDILGSSGSRRGNGGATAATNQTSPGVTTVWAGGVNYKDNWGPKTDITGSYFYNFQHLSNNGSSNSLKTFPEADTSNSTNANNSAFQRTTNQRIYINLEQKIDSATSFVFRPNVTFQKSNPEGSSDSRTVDQNGLPINSTVGTSSSTLSGFNINGSNLTIRHKFKHPYQTLSLDIDGTANVNAGNGYYTSTNRFYAAGAQYRVDSLNQYYNDSLHSYNFSPTLSYTQPIAKNQVLEFNYNYSWNKSTTINNTYDFDDATQSHSIYDSLFSNSYKFTSNSNRFSLNYRIQNAKFNLNFGTGLQYLNFDSHNTTKDITVSHDYVNFTPRVILRYSFSKTKRVQFFYQGRTGTPNASQLQPLTTTTDSINYVTGNPDLKPQFTHSVRMLYSSFDPVTQNVVFATINASTIVNDIQSKIINTAKGGQSSTYVNLNGTYNISGYFNYGFALKKPKSNLNLITNINYSQSQSLIYSDSLADYVHDYSKNTTLGETVSWTTNIKKNFDMNFSYGATYNIVRNSFNPSQNLDYFTQKFSAEITAYTNSGWLIATTFDYINTNTHVAGYNSSVPLLSPSIAKSIFKKKNGEIRLTTFDLLNANTYVNKTPSNNGGYTVSRLNTLSRYLMLTFTWNLNKFPASGQQNRMPGFFQNMRRGGGGGRGPGGPIL